MSERPNPDSAGASSVEGIRRALANYRFSFVSERELQDGIALALAAEGVAFSREKRLSALDVVDFLSASGVAIEVKVRGGVAEIARQLARYAEAPCVLELLLVTRKMQHAHGFPETLGGKPLRVLALEASAL